MIVSQNPKVGTPLYMALELDSVRWHLGFSTAMAQPMRTRSIAPGDVSALQQEIESAVNRMFPQAPPVEIVSCYEAGRDGFWLHRTLAEQGHPVGEGLAPIPIRNVVIDAASMSVSRQARRAKSDSIDRESLMRHLVRWNEGESKVWRVVRVPSREDENARLLEREIETLITDRTREHNRISGALKLHGVQGRVRKATELEALRSPDGRALPPELVAVLRRGFARLDLLASQISELESQRKERLALPTRASEMARRLMELKGLGEVGSSLLVHEMFAWRDFHNRREVGSSAGLCPTPYASGGSHREQGISRSGNRRVRKIANQLAWIWVRNQPDSPITRWFENRFASAGSRGRKIGITAVARKLLVALWRYLDQGLVPAGARFKPTWKLKTKRSPSNRRSARTTLGDDGISAPAHPEPRRLKGKAKRATAPRRTSKAVENPTAGPRP